MSANIRAVLARPLRPWGSAADALWRYEIPAGPLTRQLTDTLSRRERAGVNGVAI